MKPLNHAKESIFKLFCPASTSKLTGYFFVFMLTVLVAGCGAGETESAGPGATSPSAEPEVTPPDVIPAQVTASVVVAKTGPIVAVRVGETPILDGSKSFTSSSAALSFSWSFTHKPDASNARLQGATTANPSFVADARGVYMVQLVASDAGVSSQRAIQTVVVTLEGERLTGPFNHPGLSSDCVNCHDGVLVNPGKSPDHIGTSNLCQACHTPQGAAIIPFVDHLEVFGNCSECHNGTTAIGKSLFHAPTNAECDDCHNTSHFLERAQDGSFDHSNISRSCSGCHNGTVAIGKHELHVVSNTECGYCHTTASFLPAYPDHTDPAIVGNGCDSCHNGSTAAGPSVGHPATRVDCDTCHNIETFNLGGIFDHSVIDSVSQPCADCHNDNTSINAPSKSSAVSSHVATSSDCGSCHNTNTFVGAFVDHTGPGVVGKKCDSCHGVTAVGKSLNHMPTSEDCSVCHTPGTFTSGIFSHGASYIGPPALCADCHNNVITVGKLINHLPTNGDCADCHQTTGFLPAAFDHTGIAGNCVSCHDGNISTGKAFNHLPTNQNCSVCHTYTTIGSSPAPFKDTQSVHVGTTGNCESCHSGNPDHIAVGAIGKLPDHIPALNECSVCHKDTAPGGFASSATFISDVHSDLTQGCEGCHVSQFLPTANSSQNITRAASHLTTGQDCYLCHTITAFAPSVFAHTGITGNCASCHDGSANNIAVGARGATNTTIHQSTNEDCGTCHNTTNFLDAFVDHTGPDVIGKKCDACHDGGAGGAIGKHAGHVPTNQDCAVCHVAGGTFIPAVFDHTGITDNCASCHNGTTATGLSPTHPDPLGRDCSVCHNTTAFTGASYDHTGIVNNCTSCHNGVTATGKTPAHVPTNGDCSNCHLTTGFIPATFNHVGIVDNCASCHDAGFAIGKPVNHVATSEDCSACHNTRTFIGTVFDHTGIAGDCVQCHNGIINTGKTINHLPTDQDCSVCHTYTTISTSPAPFRDTPNFAHTGITGNCESCHSGNPDHVAVGAIGKLPDHIPALDECFVCHKDTATGGFASSAIFTNDVHSGLTQGCEGCHTSKFLPTANSNQNITKAASHLPTVQDCYYCHTITVFAPVTDIAHTGITGNCASCHDGSANNVAVGARGATNTTIHQSTNEDCGTCHNTTNFLGAFVDHSGPDVVGKRCDACHDGGAGGAVGKNAGHVPTTQDCDVCHVAGGTFIPAVFDHTGISNNCASCHDGAAATGLTPTHLPTNGKDCSECHNTTAFIGAKYDHTGIVNNCTSCHDGVTATGKTPEHIPTNGDCSNCHQTTGFIPATFDHVGIVDNCASCHGAGFAPGKSVNHVATNEDCSVCHNTLTFIGTVFDHTGIAGDCVSCHNGNINTGKAINHLPTAQDCSVCHTFTTIGSSPAPFKDTPNFAHTGITGNCESCHSGNPDHIAVGAIGKLPDHIPALDECFMCHKDTTTGGFASSATFMSDVHSGQTQGCEGCHVSQFLPTANSNQNITKAASHLPTVQDCYYCHTITVFAPVTDIAHTGITGNCASCHDGSANNVAVGARGATNTTIHQSTNEDCGTCHNTTNFLGAFVDHSGPDVVGKRCDACHDGGAGGATGKNAGHVPTTQDCGICHVAGGTFIPAVFDHTGITNNCASCHNGTDATGLTPTHLPTDGKDCSECHNTTAFIGAKYDHTGIVNNCTSCHDGVTARGKLPDHVPTNGDCSNCHQTTGFIPATFDHVGIVDNCASCHGAGFAPGKSVNHIVSNEDCSVCHDTSTFIGAVFDHTGVINNCASCHNGLTAVGKSLNHLPTTEDCSMCHITTAFIGASFDHTSTIDNCASCHNGVTASGKSPDHVATSNKCEACHTAQGFAIITSVDHLEVFGNCSECHNGITAIGKSDFHAPTNAECDNCHNTTSFLELAEDGSYDHSNILRSCSGCHNGTVSTGKTDTAIHNATNTECGSCHTTTSFVPAYPDHTDPAIIGNGCDSCHNGTNATGPSIGHPVVYVDCDTCHSILTFSLGGVFNHSLLDPEVQSCDSCHNDNTSINAPSKSSAVSHTPTDADCGSCHNTDTFFGAFVDHTGITNNCQTCHGQTAIGKSPNHMPTNPDAPGTDGDHDCADCHTIGTFKSGTYDHAGVVDNCASCHDNVITVGKLINHLPTNGDCSDCHQTTGFVPTTFDHVGIVDNCVSCHDGNISTGKAINHLPTDQDCSVCHTYTTIGTSPEPFKDTQNVHTDITGNCESCHSGNTDHVAVGAIGKLPDHIPALDECFVCHKDTVTGGFASSATFLSDVHSGLTQGCEGCHVNPFLASRPDLVKSVTHLPTAQDCYLCHAITAFFPSIFAHAGITDNCVSCHDGSLNNVAVDARGATDTAIHRNTSEDCSACHNTTTFLGAFIDHNGPDVVGKRCDSCHNGFDAIGKGAKTNPPHVTTSEDCDVCHVAGGTFVPSVFDHAGITSNCASCHDGIAATGLTPGHLPTDGKDCSVCHNTTAFIGASYDHTGIVNNCVSCHDGVTARGKAPPPDHVPTNGDCSDCHQTTGFIPATFSHTGIVDNCTSCHGAGFAIDKPVNHLPTSEGCGLCHNTSTFIGAVMEHTGIIDNCTLCHDGTGAIGKDAKLNPAHFETALDCSACHTTATFLGGTWIHDDTSTGQCDTCHSTAGGARSKPGGHLSTTVQCDECHSTNGWAPDIFSHDTGGNYPGDHRIDPGCIGCHGNSISLPFNYPFNQYAPDCAACHANDFSSESDHIGGKSGTVEQNRDCGRSGCHKVTDSNFD